MNDNPNISDNIDNINDNIKENNKFLVTPLHHTSWRDLIEKYIDEKNINVLELSDNMYSLDLENLDFEAENIKVVVIGHLFGKDFDLEILAEMKKKHNFLVIEDRVQGGTADIPFSHDCIDLSFYSMGMDKRPCALGGGYVNIRKSDSNNNIFQKMMNRMKELPVQTRWHRFKDLVKKIPTYAIYSYQSVYKYTAWIMSWRGMDLASSVQYYRKQNPGFSHNNYMMRPHPSLQWSMKQNRINHREIEKRLNQNFNFFYRYIRLDYVPWLQQSSNTLTMYNTVYIPCEELKLKLQDLKRYKIAYLPNPTWKVLNVAPPKYHDFAKNLVYLPSLYHMNLVDMQYLSAILNKKSNANL
jgi:hypothetical protein